MDGPAGHNELLKAFLAEVSVPCPGCGYDLRGLPTASCPECNQALVLRVGLAEPRMRLYIAGMMGLAAGAGFSGLLLAYVVLMELYWGRGRGPWNEFALITGAGLIVEVSFLAAWLRWGSGVRRMPVPVRLTLVVGAWLVTLLNLLVFASTIR